jgi:hypothetical protein
MGHQSCLQASLALFFTTPFGALTLISIKKQKFTNVELSKYVDFWKVGIAQNVTYEMKMKLYVEYWEDILLHLSTSLSHQSATLLEGFGLQVIVDPTILRLHY